MSSSPHIPSPSRTPNPPGQGPGAPGYRPSPARAATLGTLPFKQIRATSQPAGERLPLPGGVSEGRGSPGLNGANAGGQQGMSASMYGVIGGSRAPGRLGGVQLAGTQTRANSFSVTESRESRNQNLARTLSSHAEELPTRSHSTSPFPTFSPGSSPSASPATQLTSSLPHPHSPPKAEANVSRSRSQSLAGGVRPDGRPHPMMPMSTLENTGNFPRTFDKGWDISPEGGGNMSPFSRAVPNFEGRNGGRFVPERWNADQSASVLSHSVANALSNQPTYSTVVGGFDNAPGGQRSGSSSRRHSVSVVGGPGGRFTFDGAGGMSTISPPARGVGSGFSEEESLSKQLGNALNLEIDESRKRGIDIEARSPRGLDMPQLSSSLPKFQGFAGSSGKKDPFAAELAFGTSPARGRKDQLVGSKERGTSGDSGRDSSRSRFSFDQPAEPRGRPPPETDTPDRGRGMVPGPTSGFRPGPGAIGGPATAPFDPRFMPYPPSGFRPSYGLPSPMQSYQPSGYPRPQYGFYPRPMGYGGYPQSMGPPMGGPGFSPPSQQIPLPPQGGYGNFFPPPSAPLPTGAPAPGSPGAPTSPSSFSSLSLADLGKGIPLGALPPNTPLYIVTFKAGRRDVFYCPDPTLLISNGDLVIVEADRGSDLGTVVFDQLTPLEVREWQERQATAALLSGASQHQPPGMAVAPTTTSKAPTRVAAGELEGQDLSTLLAGVGPGGSQHDIGMVVRGPLAKEIMPKRIFTKSAQGPEEQARMMEKQRDEYEAMMICREKVAARGLPMQIVDAEYQWDRRKLTFYFKAEKRVDFRDLTKENFRIFKSRIWMSMVPRDDPRN